MIAWAFFLLAALSAPFDILGIEQLVIDAKTEPEAVRLSKQAERTKDGFRLKAPKASLETRAIPGGLAWRPPHQAKITVKVSGELDPSRLRVSVRYGADGRHWSDWIPLALQEKRDRKPGKPFTWSGEVKVEKRGHYEALLSGAWLESAPRWRSDEDELCRWIAKSRPELFEKQIPLIGWLECRVEWPEKKRRDVARAPSPALITKLELESIWAVGGLHVTPPEGMKPDYDAKWHFRLPEPKKEEDDR